MSNVPLIINIEACLEEDLELAATLIDVICFAEANTPSLINASFSPTTFNIYLNTKRIEVKDLIVLYENEEVDFLCLPPSSYPDSEMTSLFSIYPNYKEIDFQLKKKHKGLVHLKEDLVKDGVTAIQPFYNWANNSPNLSIINLGKSFHFFTSNYNFGILIPLLTNEKENTPSSISI